jgi:hypothetical protein
MLGAFERITAGDLKTLDDTDFAECFELMHTLNEFNIFTACHMTIRDQNVRFAQVAVAQGLAEFAVSRTNYVRKTLPAFAGAPLLSLLMLCG